MSIKSNDPATLVAGLGDVSRRQTLRMAAGLGFGLGFGLGLGAAGSTLIAPINALAQSPRRSGVARIATEITDATASLDPVKILTNTDIARAFQIQVTS